MNNTEHYYKQQVEYLTQQKQNLESKSKNLSIMRLICFVAMGFSIYQCFVSAYPKAQIMLSVMFFMVFLWLLKKHDKVQLQRDWTKRMLLINNNELDVLNGKPSAFDNGSTHFSTESYFYDLDIFGTGSVYHLLNRTGTSIGAQTLAHQLKNPLESVDEIRLQQAAVNELAQNPEFRQNILAAALSDKGKVSDMRNVEAWANRNEKLSKPWWRYVVIIAPALFVTALVFGIFTDNYYFLSVIFVLNLGANYLISRGIDKVHSQLSGASKILNQYANIFKIINQNKFTAHKLTAVWDVSKNAAKQLKQLSLIIGYFDQRMNLLVAVFFNAIFFYDLHCVMQLEKWKKRNAQPLNNWFDSLAKIETLNSFATLAFNNPQYINPTIGNGKQIIQAQNLSHPLILPNKRISNNVEFGAQSKVILITGSNMSGKSTFLRTIGVNMLLASCGAPVCATEFYFYPVKIYTSLRQSDSLQEDTSFFYAELKKLSEIVKHLEAGEQAIVMLDEVLKGTNSDDKTYGSQELIRRLIRFNALSLIATHDISLGKIENEANGLVENYCFESSIENNELLFDYKLHKGIAVNKNATFLMKKMGIIIAN